MGKQRSKPTVTDWAAQADRANIAIRALAAEKEALRAERDLWRERFFTRQVQNARLRNVWWRRLWWTLRKKEL